MEYTLRKTSTAPDKIDAYANLLSSVFTSTNKFTKEFLTWQYAENPHGDVVGYDAYLGDELAGHYVAIPVLYKIAGKETKGLLSLNTATHENHRGKGLFTKLANRTYEEAKKLGYEFIIGVANQNSTHGFLKKLGFYLISPLEVKTGIGSISPEEHENYLASPVWDEVSLKWRLNNPKADYYRNKKGAIFSKTDKKGIYAVLHQNDFSTNNLKHKKPIFMLWLGLANKIKTNGMFINLPEKFKPSPLNLIFKDLTGQLPQLKKNDFLFQAIDFDGF